MIEQPPLPPPGWSTPKPAYKLHPPENVAIAAFLGSPIAGAYLMASNDRKLGNASRATVTLIGAFIGTVVLFAVATLIPKGFPSYVLPIAYVAGMRSWAMSTQGKALEDHLKAQGEKASSWAAAGVGVVSLVLVLVCAVAFFAFGPASLTDQVEVAKGQTISFEDGATRKDAERLGEILKKAGMLTGAKEIDIRLAAMPKDQGYTVSFVLDDAHLNDASTEQAFREIGAVIKAGMGGAIEVKLCDELWSTKKTLAIK